MSFTELYQQTYGVKQYLCAWGKGMIFIHNVEEYSSVTWLPTSCSKPDSLSPGLSPYINTAMSSAIQEPIFQDNLFSKMIAVASRRKVWLLRLFTRFQSKR